MKGGYPEAQLEFEDWFSTEEKCAHYLLEIRWPEGFRCPRCQHPEAWTQTRGRHCCARCRHQSTLTSGTLFEGTHLSLRLWFRAIWWVINQKHGVSAAGLQKGLGLGSYRTAWLVLHKIRSTMAVPHRKPLSGQVEVDEAWVGGKKKALSGRNRKAGPMIAVAVEVPGPSSQLGRIRMKHIPSNDGEQISKFVKENIAPGSHLMTDLQAGIALPAPEGSWYCSARWCGYWSRCKGRSKTNTQPLRSIGGTAVSHRKSNKEVEVHEQDL